MRLPKIDIGKEINDNIYYIMGAVDFSKYLKNPDFSKTKSHGANSNLIYKLICRYATEELNVDIINLRKKITANNRELGGFEYDVIELSKATICSKIITLSHEIGHGIVANSGKKYNARIEEIIVETGAYVVLLCLGLSITDVNYLKKHRTVASNIKNYYDDIKNIAEKILCWVYQHKNDI